MPCLARVCCLFSVLPLAGCAQGFDRSYDPRGGARPASMGWTGDTMPRPAGMGWRGDALVGPEGQVRQPSSYYPAYSPGNPHRSGDYYCYHDGDHDHGCRPDRGHDYDRGHEHDRDGGLGPGGGNRGIRSYSPSTGGASNAPPAPFRRAPSFSGATESRPSARSPERSYSPPPASPPSAGFGSSLPTSHSSPPLRRRPLRRRIVPIQKKRRLANAPVSASKPALRCVR